MNMSLWYPKISRLVRAQWLWLCVLCCVCCGVSGCRVVEPSSYRQLFSVGDTQARSPVNRALSWLRIAPLSGVRRQERELRPDLLRETLPTLPSGTVNCKGCAAVVSYRFRSQLHPLYRHLGRYGRSYLYDNGLMLVLVSALGRCELGRPIVRALVRLQNGDGSWGFSFDTWGNDFYNRSYVRTGSVAWAGYGLAMFAQKCRSRRARQIAMRAYRFVDRMRVNGQTDKRSGLYRGGKGLWSLDGKRFRPGFRMESCATEHQIDVYFFLKRLARSFPKGPQRRQLLFQGEHLAAAMMKRLWLQREGRFVRGVTKKGLDRAWALDAAGAWGALFLTARKKVALARLAMKRVERRFATKRGVVTGYRPYAGRLSERPHIDWSRRKTLFLEGTAGVSMAYLRQGNAERGMWVLSQLRYILKKRKVLPYALGEQRDFPEVAAAAPTIWFVLASLVARGHPGVRGFWSER